jgi:hypothetical protein
MIKFIKAGTLGTFRPEWFEYPEVDSNVIAWKKRHSDGKPYSLFRSGFSVQTDPAVYAWQYADNPPPVDGFEAFKQGWSDGPDLIGGHGYRYYPADGLLIDGYNINPDERKLGRFPELEEAQTAAYAHFLQSLNDPTP